jgi:hypothetical protein
LFRHRRPQIGGANIENPPPSSALAEEERLRSLLLRAAARDSRRAQPVDRALEDVKVVMECTKPDW